MAEEEMTTASGEPHPAAGIADMIDLAYAQDFTKANTIFNNEIDQRMASALDQAKIGIADQIFKRRPKMRSSKQAMKPMKPKAAKKKMITKMAKRPMKPKKSKI